MRYLAVPQLPRRRLLRRRSQMALWHALADSSPQAVDALCGFRYSLEAHRTWDQTLPDARCEQCDRLTAAAERARSAMSTAEAAPFVEPEAATFIEPVRAELLKRRISQGA